MLDIHHQFHQRSVRLAVLTLDIHKSSGSDEIPPNVLNDGVPYELSTPTVSR